MRRCAGGICALAALVLGAGCSHQPAATAARATSAPEAVHPDPGAPADPPPPAPAAQPDPPAPAPRLYDRDIDWNANPVMRLLGHMTATLTETEYTHGFRVDEKKGVYAFDCSGFVAWVLRRAAPRAEATSAYGLGGRPLARDFERRIARVPFGKARGGWQRIQRVEDAEPGDVIAWIKPKIIKSPNTGHVAFIVLPPLAVPEVDHGYLVRVADSTHLLHDDDTREGRNGFGFGTILIVADPDTGEPRAYGWSGLRWRTFETRIAIGRPVR